MRLFVASLATETNTFSPVFTDIRDFHDGFYFPPGTHPDVPSLCSAPFIACREYRDANSDSVSVVEGTAAWAEPGGPVNRGAYLSLRDEILEQLRAAMPVDGVLLGLHGAMSAQDIDDCEGDLLTCVRQLVGPNTVVGATFDPHSHLTAQRAEALDVAIAFKEFPHTDMLDRAKDLVRIVTGAVRGDVKPVMSVFDCRMIDVFPTSDEPVRSFVDRLSRIETEDPDVLSVSLIHGFMAGDVAGMGTRMLVVTDDARQKGDAVARELGMVLFAMRGTTRMSMVTPEEALVQAAGMDGTEPSILADVWDNPGGGMAGDSTTILRAMLKRGTGNAALTSIWDPMAVTFCHAAGLGAEIPLRFGAKTGPQLGEPIDAMVTVTGLRSDARLTFAGSSVRLGDCAAVRLAGDIHVVLSANRVQAYSPEMFTLVDVDPQTKDILVLKSTNHFRAAFAPISTRIIYVDSGVPYPHDPAKTPYRKLDRPIWPIVANPFSLVDPDHT